MELRLLAETADVIGKVMVSYMALAVHYRVRHEHAIDGRVFQTMRRENVLGMIGITFIIIAYVLEAVALI